MLSVQFVRSTRAFDRSLVGRCIYGLTMAMYWNVQQRLLTTLQVSGSVISIVLDHYSCFVQSLVP
jgi:hypothetical protein